MKPNLSRYEVGERLDSGGMAHVWLATAKGAGGFEKRVAVKTILPHLATNPEFIEMFEREAKVAALLNHPHCIQIFDFGLEDETLYLAMELIDGLSLSRLVDAAAALPVNVVARVVGDGLEALDYVHRLTDGDGRPLGLVHRDVSLDNLLVSVDGQTKLADFGIAKASTPGLDANTRHGFLKGKLGYMAPEYVLGRAIDGRADVFAMGVVLWRALTGQPFDPAEPGPPPSQLNPRVSAALDAVVARALAEEPAERFQTAREMAQALDEVVTAARREEVGEWVQQLRQAPRAESSSSSENSLAPLELDATRLKQARSLHKTQRMKTPARPVSARQLPPARFDVVRAGALALSLLTVCGGAAVLAGLMRAEPAKRPPEALPWPVEPVRPRAPEVAAPVLVPEPKAASVAVAARPPPSEPQGPRVAVPERAPLRLAPVLPLVTGRRAREPMIRREPVREETVPTAPKLAKLDVRASPWAEVKIDGRVVGQTPLELQEVTEGAHVIELSNPELGATRKVRVVATGGEVTTVRERF